MFKLTDHVLISMLLMNLCGKSENILKTNPNDTAEIWKFIEREER